jgi:hypothetical protein
MAGQGHQEPAMSGAAHWRSVLSEVEQAGLCAHPIRLRGLTLDRTTGELAEGTIVVACKDRRVSVCPSCSMLYRADAWQLVAAGIRGGKGVDPSVTEHPQLFVTLTAPSFGAVHRSGERHGRRLLCRPRRNAGLCPHGIAFSCTVRHGEKDPILGNPLCPECFDYRGAVLWNAHLSALWARTCACLYREVAAAAGLSTTEVRHLARLSYFKVVEFQARGLAHLHVVLRADGGGGPTDLPPPWLDTAALATAVAGAVARSHVPVPAGRASGLRRARWGHAFDIRVLDPDAGDADAIAGYIGKYASKTADSGGWLAHRIRTRAEIERLTLRPHLVALVRAAWILGCHRQLSPLHLREHAHTLGYGGQFSSKSVAYSTTFSALRAARADYVDGLRGARPDYDGEWRYVGRGYDSPEAETLAEALLDARLIVSRGLPNGSTSSATEGSTAS